MRAYDLIRRKRDGGVLRSDEIAWLVRAYVAGEVAEEQMAALLMAVCIRGMTGQETAALTMAMVNSGETLDLSAIRGRTVDKHSTGGVGDKTSLALVPLVASAGVRVAKLSGRGLGHTGGTLDKLEAIPGFRVELSPAELVAQVNRIGCAIAGQSARLVPADKRIYALRDRTATVESVPLIASSVMSKKIAAGNQAIVLDVKAGHGAFMKTASEAHALAEAMVAIGREVGRRTVAVLSAMEEPLGYAVGNALEVREAIATLRGDGAGDLRELCLVLGAQMMVLGDVSPDPAGGRVVLEKRLRRGEGLRKLAELIEAQGGDPRVVDDPDRLPRSPIQHRVAASREGIVAGVDAEALGTAAMVLGAGRSHPGDTIDPGAGLVMERKAGDAVRRGDTLAVLHTSDESRLETAAVRVLDAYRLNAVPPDAEPLVLEIIG
jgi:pyrimidine-nucleoside phosphorylase